MVKGDTTATFFVVGRSPSVFTGGHDPGATGYAAGVSAADTAAVMAEATAAGWLDVWSLPAGGGTRWVYVCHLASDPRPPDPAAFARVDSPRPWRGSDVLPGWIARPGEIEKQIAYESEDVPHFVLRCGCGNDRRGMQCADCWRAAVRAEPVPF